MHAECRWKFIKSISELRIKFETGDFDIEPVITKFELFTNVFVSHKQFPDYLVYWMTIHKRQGLI